MVNHDYGLSSSSLLPLSQNIDQSYSGEDRTYFVYYPRWLTITKEVKEGNWRRSHGGMLLADLFTGCKLSGFVKHSRTTSIGNGTIHYVLGTPVSINNQDNLPRMCSWSNVIWIISQSWLYSQVTLDNVTFTVKAKQNNIYVGLGGFTVFISVSWIIFSL